MNINWVRGGFLLVVLGVSTSGLMPETAFGVEEEKESIAALFDGIPADLRSKVQNNSVRRDRVNDWLGDQVNGKGKTVELQVSVRVNAARGKDGTYTVIYAVGAIGKGKGKVKGPTAAQATGFGDSGAQGPGFGGPGGKGPGVGALGVGGGGAQFPAFGGGPEGSRVSVLGDEWSIALKLGANDPEKFWPNQFELSGVSVADAEKQVELKKVTIKGKVQEALVGSGGVLRLTLAEIQVDGRKMTPRKREPAKEAPPKQSAPPRR